MEAGKSARKWIEAAVREASPGTTPAIEYFNYAVLNLDAICWEDVIGHLEPDIILMVVTGTIHSDRD